jgi:tight adherence protein B
MTNVIIILFPIMLILIGFLNLMVQRSKYDRLNIFNKVERQVIDSYIVQLNNKKKKNDYSTTIFERIILKIIEVYSVVFGFVDSSTRLKNIGVCLVVMGVGVYANINFLHFPMMLVVIASCFLSIIAIYLYLMKKLKADFDGNFPEALNLIVGIVSSGSSLSQGLHETGEKISGVVGEIFREISRRLDIGDDTERVLMDSYKKLPFKEYYFFTLVLIVNMQGGGEIKEIMYRLSKMINSSKVLERNRDGKTAELRMTVKILSCLPFGFIGMLYLISKENFYFLTEDPTGRLFLYYVIGSVFIGRSIIRGMISKVV